MMSRVPAAMAAAQGCASRRQNSSALSSGSRALPSGPQPSCQPSVPCHRNQRKLWPDQNTTKSSAIQCCLNGTGLHHSLKTNVLPLQHPEWRKLQSRTSLVKWCSEFSPFSHLRWMYLCPPLPGKGANRMTGNLTVPLGWSEIRIAKCPSSADSDLHLWPSTGSTVRVCNIQVKSQSLTALNSRTEVVRMGEKKFIFFFPTSSLKNYKCVKKKKTELQKIEYCFLLKKLNLKPTYFFIIVIFLYIERIFSEIWLSDMPHSSYNCQKALVGLTIIIIIWHYHCYCQWGW